MSALRSDDNRRLAPWIVALLLAPAAARADERGYRLQLDATLDGRYTNTSSNLKVLEPTNPLSFAVNYGQADGAFVGGARLQVFFKRVRADGTAPQLQPFLQRASVVWFEGHGAYESTSDKLENHSTRQGGGASVGTDLYLVPAFALWLAAGADRFSQNAGTSPDVTTRRTTAFDLAGGVAVRAGDTRIGLGYRYRGAFTSATGPGGVILDDLGNNYRSTGFGAFRLDLRSVLNRKADLVAGLSLWDAGGTPGFGADVRATLYLKPATGLLFGLGGSGGEVSPGTSTQLVLEDPSPSYVGRTIVTFQWQLGVTHFFSPLYGLEVTYTGRLDHKELSGGHTDAVGTDLLARGIARF